MPGPYYGVTMDTRARASISSRRRIVQGGVLLAALALGGITRAADATRTLNYQGFLSNTSSGLPINGPKDMQFVLYDSVTGGSALFTDTRCNSGSPDGPAIGVTQGRYEVEIGSQTAGRIPASVFEDRDAVWLEVRVDTPADNCAGFEVLTPRIRLQAAPYAFKALQASTATAVRANIDAVVTADADANGSGSVSVFTGAQNRIFVANAGSTGVGTTVPGATLHISSQASSGSTQLLKLSTGSAAEQEIFSITKTGLMTGVGNIHLREPAFIMARDLVNGDAGAGDIYINGGVDLAGVAMGDVVIAGIGRSPIDLAGGNVFLGRGGTGPSGRVYIGTADNLGVLELYGNIGISTGSPQSPLDVQGAAAFGQGVTRSTFSNTGDLTLARDGDLALSGPAGYINTASSVNASAFFGNGAGLTGLASAGGWSDVGNTVILQNFTDRIGVGTTSPQAALHISSAPNPASNSLIRFSTGSNLGDDVFTLTGQGRLGLGTTNPEVKLQVADLSPASASGQPIFRLHGLHNSGVVGSGPSLDFRNDAAGAIASRIRSFTTGASQTGIAFDTGYNAPQTRMIVDNTGAVGIGLTAASALLHVSTQATSPSTEIFRISSGSLDSQKLFRVWADGKVAVLGEPNAHYGVVLATAVWFTQDTTMMPWTAQLWNANYTGANNQYLSNDSAFAVIQEGTVDRLQFWRAPAGTAGNGIGWTESLGIDAASGYVNVGAAVGFSTLTVHGALGFGEILQPDGCAADRGVIYFDTTLNKFRVAENGCTFADLVGGGSSGWADDGTVVRLSGASDRVGIGTTSPVLKLTVDDGSTNPIGFRLGNLLGNMDITQQSGYTMWRSSSFIFINPATHVGIGATVPAATLHVSSQATSAVAKLLMVSSGAAPGQELFVVQKDAKVGISTGVPWTELTVVGGFGMQAVPTPSGAAANRGMIYYDSTANKFRVSQNNSVYFDLVGSSRAVGHVSGFNSTLGSGTTFQAFVPDTPITLNRITATVVVPGVGGAGDTFYCANGANWIRVTVPAASVAGTVTTSVANVANVAQGGTVNFFLSSTATTTPVVNVTCQYVNQ